MWSRDLEASFRAESTGRPGPSCSSESTEEAFARAERICSAFERLLCSSSRASSSPGTSRAESRRSSTASEYSFSATSLLNSSCFVFICECTADNSPQSFLHSISESLSDANASRTESWNFLSVSSRLLCWEWMSMSLSAIF